MARTQAGITEIQTIILSTDTEFVEDTQSIHVKTSTDGADRRDEAGDPREPRVRFVENRRDRVILAG